jgi:hypothetical protein
LQSPEQEDRTGRRERLTSLAAWAFSALLAVALSAHAYVGFFTRYMADDYCTAATVRTAGLLATQRHYYFAWSGRFSFTLTVSFVELLGTGVVPFLPAAALLCWLAATTWAVYEFASPTLGRRPLLHSFLLAELLVYATVGDNRGGVYEALYWQTGMLTYVAPLVLLTAFAGFFGRALRRGERPAGGRLALPVVFAAAFFSAGFSETSGVMQAGAFLVAAAATFMPACVPPRRRLLPSLSAGLFGSIVALTVIVLAPGNSVRESALPAHSDLLTVFTRAFSNTFAHAFSEHNDPGTAPLRWAALLLPALLSFCLARGVVEAGRASKPWRSLLALTAAGVFLCFCCFLPASYALSAAPPSRALVVPQFVLVCTLASLGWVGGRAIGAHLSRGHTGRRPAFDLAPAALALLLSLPVVATARRTFSQAGKARALARLWDRHDAEMRAWVARGEKRLTVPVAYNIGGTDLMKRDPQWYVNHCVAVFYGAESVTALPDEEGFRVVAGE